MISTQIVNDFLELRVKKNIMNIGYLTNFIVYAFAMSGVMLIAVSIYKKVCGTPGGKSNGKLLSVQDKLAIAPRKNLYVVRAGEEYFLIAGDSERTTMLSKLDMGKKTPVSENFKEIFQPKQTFYEGDIGITNKKILKRINEKLEEKEEEQWKMY